MCGQFPVAMIDLWLLEMSMMMQKFYVFPRQQGQNIGGM